MNDKQLKQLLTQIAEKEIPDDMDLWKPIQAQLEGQTVTRKPMLRLVRLAVAIAILLLVSLISYAVYQNNIGDPGLSGAEEADLLTYIEESQTIDDVTVTLTWAYADEHRIALTYETTFDRAVVGDSIGMIDTTLIDKTTGTEIQSTFGGGGGGGSSDSTIAHFSATSNFLTPQMNTLPEFLDLELHLTLGDPETAPIAFGAGGGSGGGGGGGSVPPGEPIPQNVPDNPIEPIEFIFEFSVPLLPALKIEVDQTVEINGVAIQLQDVAITPSLTRAMICYTPPTDDQQWILVTTLQTEGMTLVGNTNGFGMALDGMDCLQTEYLAPYSEQSSEWTLSIERLRTRLIYTPENEEQFIAAMEAKGFTDVVVNPGTIGEPMGFGFGMSSEMIPAEQPILLEEAISEVTETIEGPWEFTITIR